MRRRARARVRGHRPGGGLPARTSTGWRASSGSPATCSTTPTGCCSRSRATSAAVDEFLARLGSEAPPLAVDRAGHSSRTVARRASARFAIRPSPRGEAADAPVTPDSATCERLPARAVRSRPTAATATRSSTAPTAGRGSRSSAGFPTTGRSRRWPAFAMCAALPGASTRTRRTGASTPSRTPARSAGRRSSLLDCRGRPVDAADARARPPPTLLGAADPRGQGDRRLSPRVPRRRRGGGGGAAGPQAPRGQAVRADGRRRSRRPRELVRSARSASALLTAARAPDRARAPPRRARPWPRVGGARARRSSA